MLDASSSESLSSLADTPQSAPTQADAAAVDLLHAIAPDRDQLDQAEPCFDPWHYVKPKVCKPYVSQRFDPNVPPSAIRDRDLSALTFLFNRYDMAEVEDDIERVLSRLPPTPCWEDEDLEFLKH